MTNDRNSLIKARRRPLRDRWFIKAGIVLLLLFLSFKITYGDNMTGSLIDGWEKGNFTGIRGTNTTYSGVSLAIGYDGLNQAFNFSPSGGVIYGDDMEKWRVPNLTIIAVVKPRTLSSGGIGVFDYLTNKNIYSPPSYTGYGLRLRYGANQTAHSYIMDGDQSFNVLVTTSLVSLNNWHFIAMTFNNKTLNNSIYYGGNLESQSIIPRGIVFNVTDKFSIGNTYETDYKTADALDGFIDRLYIFNRSFSQTEINTFHNSSDFFYYEDMLSYDLSLNETPPVSNITPIPELIYYDFDYLNRISGTYIDLARFANGTILDAENASGLFNESVFIDGVTSPSGVKSGIDSALTGFTDDWTISMLIYPDDITTDLNGIIGCIDGSNNGFAYRISGTSGEIEIFNGSFVDTNISIQEDKWTHLIIEHDYTSGTDEAMRIYRNGSLLFNKNMEDFYCSSGLNITIGSLYHSLYGEENLEGRYDEFRFYNYIINATYRESLWDLYNGSECEEDWTCTSYAPCNSSDLSPCNSTIDLNSCGGSYTGDYSEFAPIPCDFCTPLWTCIEYGFCSINNTAICNLTMDGNGCSEAYTGDYSEFMEGTCDYCLPVLETSISACIAGLTTSWINVTNYASCCLVTNSSDDCVFSGYDSRDFGGNITYTEACSVIVPPVAPVAVSIDLTLLIVTGLLIAVAITGIATNIPLLVFFAGLGFFVIGVSPLVTLFAVKMIYSLFGLILLFIFGGAMFSDRM